MGRLDAFCVMSVKQLQRSVQSFAKTATGADMLPLGAIIVACVRQGTTALLERKTAGMVDLTLCLGSISIFLF